MVTPGCSGGRFKWWDILKAYEVVHQVADNGSHQQLWRFYVHNK